MDCVDAARHRLPTSEKPVLPDHSPDHTLGHGPGRAVHTHTPDHQMICYALIFPLYVAGRSKAVPDVEPWVVNQLRHIGSHFSVRNAEDVAQILERKADINPWEVYAMLGSYAFAS